MVKQQGEASFKFAISISFLVAIVICTILIFSWQEADATTIGISISGSCERSENCPDYLQLEKGFDNSNQLWSGFFDYSANGKYERQPSPYQHSIEWYRHSNALWIIVDPDGEAITKVNHHITIEPSSFIFFDAGDSKIKPVYELIQHNRTKQICADFKNPKCFEFEFYYETVKKKPVRIERHNQYISDNCRTATITFDALISTVNHFLDKCKNKQSDEYIFNIPLPQIPFEYKDSQWAKHAEWLKKAQINCKQKC